MAEEITQKQKDCLAEVRALRLEGIRLAKELKNTEAEALYWQAFRLHEEVLGSDNPAIAESLNQIIFFYGSQWRRIEAEPLIRRSFALLQQKPGPKHRGVLQTLDALASHAYRLEQFEDAKAYYKQVLEMREELLGVSHPRVAATQEKYATLLRQLGDRDEAAMLEKRAAMICNEQVKISERS